MLRFVACVSVFVLVCFAKQGIDLSQYCDEFTCLHQEGYDFAIPRCFLSNGQLDPNCHSNINNAHNGGFSDVDVYMFPCYPCGNPSSQMTTLVNSLKGYSYGRIWLDIEKYQWSSSQSSNQAFITSLIEQGEAMNQKLGIYSSYYNWESIVGLGFCYPEQQGLPLWYADYDNNPSFSDYVMFGCWKTPLMKQFEGNAHKCNFGVDLDFKN